MPLDRNSAWILLWVKIELVLELFIVFIIKHDYQIGELLFSRTAHYPSVAGPPLRFHLILE